MSSGPVLNPITKEDILMSRDREYPLDDTLLTNLDRLVRSVNKFQLVYGKQITVSSGYRPGKYNVAAHGAPNSSHLTCEAVDFHDADGKVKEFVKLNPYILVDCDLYQEDPSRTLQWIHVQTRPTKSGKRVFVP